VSRELYTRDEELQNIKRMVESQQEFVKDLLADHRNKLEEKIQNKGRRFGSKQLEKQFQVNWEFKECAQRILDAIQIGDKDKAEEVTTSLIGKLEEHEQDLIIADTSPHGWLAVAKVRSNTDLPKNIRKKLDQVERDLAARRQRHDGGSKKKFFQLQGPSREHHGGRGNRRVSPEELLFQATKQLRVGTCVHCGKGQHFFKECPEFWSKVIQSREAKAKASATN